MNRLYPLLALAVVLGGCAAPSASVYLAKPAIPAEVSTLPVVAPVYGPSNPKPSPDGAPGTKYFASIVGLDPAKEKLYRELHANVWPEVLAAMTKAHIVNFNIFVTDIGGRRYLVSTFEYSGTDLDKDFGTVAADPVTRDKWWPITDACQIRLPGTPEGAQWRSMEQVMHQP